ncbi:hypothetical protein AB0L00_28165 [Actinoallomurus sp. NPDC052308]|uniref:hypothetical protein n=1 Tax=Actinoallomurus sp. NPDC052308 TaxID=3155530 RepID=UPI00341A92F8
MVDDAELINMREKWSGGWRIWRARRAGDVGEERSGEYVASRMEADAGVDQTVVNASLARLDVLLGAQAEAAQAGRRPCEIHAKWADQW